MRFKRGVFRGKVKITELTEKDMERLNKYLRAWRYLTRDEPM
jgi:hypothetical protein